MLQDILTAISLGRKVLSSLARLKSGAGPLFDGGGASTPSAQFDVLEKKLSNLESLARDQSTRIMELEHTLENTRNATEAVAQRVGAIFWIALGGCGVGFVALLFSILLMSHAIR